MHSKLISTAIIAGTLAVLTACGPSGPLARTLSAHGGLAKFQSYGGVSYDLTNFPFGAKPPINDHQTIDLTTRQVHITGKTQPAAAILSALTAARPGLTRRANWVCPHVSTITRRFISSRCPSSSRIRV